MVSSRTLIFNSNFEEAFYIMQLKDTQQMAAKTSTLCNNTIFQLEDSTSQLKFSASGKLMFISPRSCL